jgi:hypothetical protein
MKLNILVLAIVTLFASGLSSCKKDSGSSDTPPVPGVAGDSSYLSVIYFIYKNGGVADTAAAQIYSYDASKRLIRLKDSVWNPTSDYRTVTTVYSYTGTDTLPYRSTETTVWYLPQPNQVVNSFYFYNTTGLRIKDSVIAPTRHYVATQQYPAGKIISYRTDSIFSGAGNSFSYKEIRKDTALTNTDGNVTYNISYRGTAYIYRSTVTYDNHPNPFMKPSNAKTLALFPTGETLIMEMPQRYNRLKIVETSSYNNQTPIVQYDNDLTGKYTYKTNGYPAQISVTDISTGETEIASFKYTAL